MSKSIVITLYSSDPLIDRLKDKKFKGVVDVVCMNASFHNLKIGKIDVIEDKTTYEVTMQGTVGSTYGDRGTLLHTVPGVYVTYDDGKKSETATLNIYALPNT